jgi:hypothetical protein
MLGFQAIVLKGLLLFWQANSNEPDAAYQAGRAVGFCCVPLIFLLVVIGVVFTLYKKSKNNRPKQ